MELQADKDINQLYIPSLRNIFHKDLYKQQKHRQTKIQTIMIFRREMMLVMNSMNKGLKTQQFGVIFVLYQVIQAKPVINPRIYFFHSTLIQMNKQQKGNTMLLHQNYECNCLGQSKNEHHFFLSKPKSPSNRVNVPKTQLFNNLPKIETKIANKRSLRRLNTAGFTSFVSNKKTQTVAEAISQKHFKAIFENKQKKEFQGPTTKQLLSFENPYYLQESLNTQTSTPTRSTFLFKTISCQNLQYLPQSSFQSFYLSPPHHCCSPVQGLAAPPRINFKTTSNLPKQSIKIFSQIETAAVDCQEQKINFRNMREQARIGFISPQKNIKPISRISQLPQLQASNFNVSQVKNPELQQKIPQIKGQQIKELLKSPPKMKRNESSPKRQTAKSVINPHKSRISTTKSIIETGKSRIGTKKSLVGQAAKMRATSPKKASLKKMADVQQIHSLPDSEQLDISDQQSVVLGKLNEYGSMVETNLQQNPSIKFISLRTQSTGLGKSHLKSFEMSHFNFN